MSGADPVAKAIGLGDRALLALALGLAPATPAHLRQALELPGRGDRLAICRILVRHGANPWEGDPHAIALAVGQGRHDEAWSMQAAWPTPGRLPASTDQPQAHQA